MKLVHKYIIKEFVKVASLISSVLIALFVVVDVFENLKDILRLDMNLIIQFFLLHIPQHIYHIMPLAFLFAPFITIALLMRHNEITGLNSGGIGNISILLPILVISIFMSLIAFLINDFIIPEANRMADNIKEGNKARKAFFREDSLWLRSGPYTFYNIRLIDTDKNILWHVNIYHLLPGFQLEKNIYAKRANIMDGKGTLESGIERKFTKEGINIIPFNQHPFLFPFDLKELQHIVIQASEIRFSVLRNYIKKIREEGYEVTRLLVDLYAKISFPFTILITTIIGLSIGFYSRRYGISGGAGICIIFSVLYWVMYSFSLNLGYSGQVHPLLAAWMANILFSFIGGVMAFRIRG